MSRLGMILQRYLLPGSSISFWHTPIAPVFYDYATLADYYIDLTAKTAYKGPFDEQGIPLLDYKGAIGRQYNPCAVAQYGLGWFARWRRGEDAAREPFLCMADWLRDNLTCDSSGRGWLYYRFDCDAYALKAPWVSALSQGQAISVLLRAHQATDEHTYLTAAKTAYAALVCPIEQGGVLRREGVDVILEEVVAERMTAILDGMIFAMFGLADYCFATQDVEAKALLEKCVESLERFLPCYDLGFWSRADLYWDAPPMIASPFYHRLHVAQLKVLSRLTGRTTFQRYAVKWEKESQNPLSFVRATLSKVYFKLKYY